MSFSEARSFPLLDLPMELYLMVIEHISSPSAMYAFARTSRLAYKTARPIFANKFNIGDTFDELNKARKERDRKTADLTLEVLDIYCRSRPWKRYVDSERQALDCIFGGEEHSEVCGDCKTKHERALARARARRTEDRLQWFAVCCALVVMPALAIYNPRTLKIFVSYWLIAWPWFYQTFFLQSYLTYFHHQLYNYLFVVVVGLLWWFLW